MCIKQTLVERVHADRDRGWDNGSGVSWTEDIVPLVDAYDAAIAEVERLRSDRSLLEHEARIRRQLGYHLADELQRLRDEVQAERAAVVAWLRGGAGLRGVEPAEEWDDLWVAARDIERGEHRREEER